VLSLFARFKKESGWRPFFTLNHPCCHQPAAPCVLVLEVLVVVCVTDSDMLWDESTATCSHVAAGIQLDIVVASIGNVRDPQRRVQHVRSRVVYSAWSHPLAGHVQSNSTDAMFAFPVEMRVRFVSQVQQGQDVMRHLPPLRSSLPEDFFYPFLSDARSTAAAGTLAGCILIALVLLFVEV
jgi:hypothetical protein